MDSGSNRRVRAFLLLKMVETVPKKKKKKKKNAYANRLSLFCSLKKTSDNCMCTHSPSCHASSSVRRHEGGRMCDSELPSYWTCTPLVSCSYLEER